MLTVKEPNIYVNVNGHQAVGETEPSLLSAGAQQAWDYTGTSHINTPGQIGLQIHGGQPQMDIRFKNIEILQACTQGPNADQNLPEFVEGSNGKHPAVYEHNEALCGVSGCTDPAASNHNVAATSDNGSCTYTGCGEALSGNYFCKAHPTAFPCVGSNNYTAANISGEACTAALFELAKGSLNQAGVQDNKLVITNIQNTQNFSVEVYNVTGDLIHSLKGSNQSRYEIEVPGGLLFVKVREGKHSYVKRILSM